MTERPSDIRRAGPAEVGPPTGDPASQGGGSSNGRPARHPSPPTEHSAKRSAAPGPSGSLRQTWRSGGWFGAHRALTAGLICAVAMAVAGFPLGLLWAATAPHLDVAAGLAGHESAFAVQSDIDVRFGMICAVAGLIGGGMAFWRARDAGWPVPVGLALGGIGGSLIAGWIGHLRRSPQVLDALPKDATPLLTDLVDMKVRADGLYLVMPVVALLVLVIGLWATSRSRNDRGRAGTGVESGAESASESGTGPGADR